MESLKPTNTLQPPSERAVQYQAWAQRLRDKAQQDREPTVVDDEPSVDAEPTIDWSVEALYRGDD